jgi:hypothetical protein
MTRGRRQSLFERYLVHTPDIYERYRVHTPDIYERFEEKYIKSKDTCSINSEKMGMNESGEARDLTLRRMLAGLTSPWHMRRLCR